jgi:hypothetical protein
MNMTDEQMRIAIAEACGFTCISPVCWRGHLYGFERKVPDYLNDLNACAEFEATLTDEEHNRYRAHIYGATFHPRKCFSADAKTRAIAFIKTLNLEPK